ncbi:putative membrane protein [Pseudomonas nitritireducens]|uniref:Putative membrane protein n=1 Tax=Pseudomonas nitroreducens TaxID=46680 RepID=A0A7W7KG59_PSENT|nr:hypothetical protein [Pseudomonas nitritireducens]MBB4861513.1 putative membrane protein [Pseudomonas nitritireducens]
MNAFYAFAYFFIAPFIGSYQSNPAEFWTFAVSIVVAAAVLYVLILTAWRRLRRPKA